MAGKVYQHSAGCLEDQRRQLVRFGLTIHYRASTVGRPTNLKAFAEAVADYIVGFPFISIASDSDKLGRLLALRSSVQTSIDNLEDDNMAIRDPFHGMPMPDYEGVEPSEVDVQRIQTFLELGRFDELSEGQQQWVCRRLMPSLTRYGVYPPPIHVEEQ